MEEEKEEEPRRSSFGKINQKNIFFSYSLDYPFALFLAWLNSSSNSSGQGRLCGRRVVDRLPPFDPGLGCCYCTVLALLYAHFSKCHTLLLLLYK